MYARSCALENIRSGKRSVKRSAGRAWNGGVMFRCVGMVVVAALLFGCAGTREDLDFAAVSQTNGGPKNGQGRIVVLRETQIRRQHGWRLSRQPGRSTDRRPEDGHISRSRRPGGSPRALGEPVVFPGRDQAGSQHRIGADLLLRGEPEREKQGAHGWLSGRRARGMGSDGRGDIRQRATPGRSISCSSMRRQGGRWCPSCDSRSERRRTARASRLADARQQRQVSPPIGGLPLPPRPKR